MIYLDNAATTLPKPPPVRRAVAEALEKLGSLGRGGHAAAELAAETAYACRAAAGELFDVLPEQVVFTMNCTHGLNLAIRTLVSPGDRVVVSGFEHNAVLRPLVGVGAEIVTARGTLFDQNTALEALEVALTDDTKAVVVNHVSNVFGFIQPLESIAALCGQRGIPLIVDAAQSAGILPLSLRKLEAAFIAMPGHKGLYGPMGTGLLLCGRLPEPLIRGGTGSSSRSMEMPGYLPDRAEAGTQNVPGIAGLLAGLDFVQTRGTDAIAAHERLLKERLSASLVRIPGLLVFTSDKAQTGVLSFAAEALDCEILGRRLAERDIAVRAGLHCAPLAHETAGTLKTGTVRVSFSAFSTEADADRFAEAVGECL